MAPMTLKKLKVMLQHQCSLPPEENPVVRYINSGRCVYLRRKIRVWTIVSSKNPRSISFLKSSASIEQEKKRHLHSYYYTVHPFSLARAYWEFIGLFVLIAGLIIIPIDSSSYEGSYWLRVPKIMIDTLFFLDVIVTFFTGYVEPDTKKIILDKRKIALHYIKGFFLFDLLGSLNPQMIIKIFNKIGWADDYVRYVKVLQFFKIFRVPTMITYIDRYREWKEGSLHVVRVIKLFLVPIVLVLWLSFAMFFVSTHNKEEWILKKSRRQQYLTCIYRTILIVLLVSFGEGRSKYTVTICIEMATMISGVVFNIFVMSQTLMIVNKYNSSVNKYYQMTQGLQEYISYMRLPENLRKKIYDYFDFRFQKTYFKESEIMNTLSEQLRQAIVLHSCKNLLDCVDIFKYLPASLLIRIVTCMKSEIYLPQDVIVQAGTEGESMFFISTGTVAIYTSFGKEVCHLADGSHFGEIALVIDGEKRVASVVAVDPCELFSLHRKDFTRAIEPYPDLYFRIRKMAQDRFQKTMAQTTSEKEEASKKEFSIVNIEERERSSLHAGLASRFSTVAPEIHI